MAQTQKIEQSSVSVVIPTYNAAEFIQEAITTALEQSHAPKEIIVVDDGSTDNTKEILSDVNEIHFVRQNNKGPASARNHGASLATGQWIAFLDADDLWAPTKLEVQLRRAKEAGAELIYSNRRNFGDCTNVAVIQSEAVKLWEGQVFNQLLNGNFVTLSSVMIRSDVFRVCNGFDISPELMGAEDWDLWLRVASQNIQFAACHEPLTFYRRHAEGISRNLEQMRRALDATLARAFALRPNSITPCMKRAAKANAYGVLGWIATNAGASSIKYWRRAVFYEPTSVTNWKQLAKACLKRS